MATARIGTSLTIKDIEREPTGPCLDQLVAEHIMQWTNEREADHTRASRYTMEPHGRGTTRGLGVWHHGTWGWFAPSSRMADAWCLVEHGAPSNWFDNVALIRYGAGYAGMVLAGKDAGTLIAAADTAPLAICRTALVLAIGRRDDD